MRCRRMFEVLTGKTFSLADGLSWGSSKSGRQFNRRRYSDSVTRSHRHHASAWQPPSRRRLLLSGCAPQFTRSGIGAAQKGGVKVENGMSGLYATFVACCSAVTGVRSSDPEPVSADYASGRAQRVVAARFKEQFCRDLNMGTVESAEGTDFPRKGEK